MLRQAAPPATTPPPSTTTRWVGPRRSPPRSRTTRHKYTDAGRTVRVVTLNAVGHSSALDPSGNHVAVTDANGTVTSARFDGLGRLTGCGWTAVTPPRPMTSSTATGWGTEPGAPRRR